MPGHIGAFRGRAPVESVRATGRGLAAGVLFYEDGRHWLRDVSGKIEAPAEALAGLDPRRPYWAALRFEAGRVERVYAEAITASSEFTRLQRDFERHQARWAVHQRIRGFFLERGFLEADTPVRVPCPSMEPHLDSFATDGLYLRTSPELHLKRLLAAGFDKLFEIGPCFRAGERGSQHREEFLLLEWYRTFADLDALIDDLRHLLKILAPMAADPAYLQRPFEIVTVQELFAHRLGVSLTDQSDPEPLRACLRRHKIDFAPEDDWDTLYFRVFLNLIEADLGGARPTIVRDYPASQAALAKKGAVEPGRMPYCHRFELYLRGVEIANAFYELTDPVEQRARFEADRRLRRQLGKTAYAVDEGFIAALESGLPPSAGIALGLDRLVAVMLGADGLDALLPFPAEP